MSSPRSGRPTSVAATALWARAVLVAPSGAEILVIVMTGPGRPDLSAVDALARWQLWARRAGGAIELRATCEELSALLSLAGLLGEVGGEAESGEEARRVEEGVEPGDLLA